MSLPGFALWKVVDLLHVPGPHLEPLRAAARREATAGSTSTSTRRAKSPAALVRSKARPRRLVVVIDLEHWA